ncbi:dual adapter for phosphotyrosine and 3-phosphotyrosine and 3-phosphoinositide-like isoform X2 [Clytia hemisphaerica]|uniref:Dual adapter for phosphotyrosine and 3-phosphotyrosine and 3-phosphoinositide n=1 Tax=Clytia hemisphaerica TaxID=252671 RepID=A0A7M5XLB3_9CNID
MEVDKDQLLDEISLNKMTFRVNDQGIAEYSDDDSENDEASLASYNMLDYFDGGDELPPSRESGSKSRSSKLNRIEDLPFYHPGVTRNTCEALLLANGIEGSYLVRPSGNEKDRFTVSVRCSNSIKHYALDINHFKHTYAFGIAQFDSIDELSEHFKCMPVLGSESGTSVTLRHPYKHDIPEPTQYEHVVRHAELGKQTSFNQDMAKPSPDLHIASKEGYLIKRGAIHKNWKKRWFVLQKNLLKYYKEKEESTPIKTIDLVDAMHAVEDFCDGRNNCFRLAMPTRIFYFVASSPSEAKSWIELLQWKIEYYQERKTNQSKTRLNNSLKTAGELAEHAAYLGQHYKQ